MRKFLMVTTAAIVVSSTSAAVTHAGEAVVPAKFRGTWVSAEYKDGAPTVIGTNSIFFSGKCDITKVVPADEDGKSIAVSWKCPEYPNMLPVNVVWKLTKVNGQEVLMQINAECGACSSIMRRVKP
jgi:hypothetical protein